MSGNSDPDPGGRNRDISRFVGHYHMMWRIRAFEETAIAGARGRLAFGAIHPSVGQEAVATGVCANLRRSDIVLSTHRGHGHTLAKGADITAMMCELLGRRDGTCGGKGGSMHIADFDCGMLGANGVVAANIPIAAGAAHAIRLRGEDRLVVCFFGDGAVNRGPFLEGLNWAKIHTLPVLFVCEDNSFSSTTRTAALTAGGGAAARAQSLDIEAASVDGNDVVAVDDAAREMIASIRAGGGPKLLHARTYRLLGHTSFDAAAYRAADEVEAAWHNDPILRLGEWLCERGIAGRIWTVWRRRRVPRHRLP